MGARSPVEEMGGPTRMWAYGTGGDGANHPEYERRLTLVERLIKEYAVAFPNRARFIRTGIDPVPETWINKRLEEVGENWRIAQQNGRLVMPRIE